MSPVSCKRAAGLEESKFYSLKVLKKVTGADVRVHTLWYFDQIHKHFLFLLKNMGCSMYVHMAYKRRQCIECQHAVDAFTLFAGLAPQNILLITYGGTHLTDTGERSFHAVI